MSEQLHNQVLDFVSASKEAMADQARIIASLQEKLASAQAPVKPEVDPVLLHKALARAREAGLIKEAELNAWNTASLNPNTLAGFVEKLATASLEAKRLKPIGSSAVAPAAPTDDGLRESDRYFNQKFRKQRG